MRHVFASRTPNIYSLTGIGRVLRIVVVWWWLPTLRLSAKLVWRSQEATTWTETPCPSWWRWPLLSHMGSLVTTGHSRPSCKGEVCWSCIRYVTTRSPLLKFVKMPVSGKKSQKVWNRRGYLPAPPTDIIAWSLPCPCVTNKHPTGTKGTLLPSPSGNNFHSHRSQSVTMTVLLDQVSHGDAATQQVTQGLLGENYTLDSRNPHLTFTVLKKGIFLGALHQNSYWARVSQSFFS